MVGGRRRVAGGGRRSLEGSRYHPRGRDIIDTFPPLFAHRFPPFSFPSPHHHLPPFPHPNGASCGAISPLTRTSSADARNRTFGGRPTPPPPLIIILSHHHLSRQWRPPYGYGTHIDPHHRHLSYYVNGEDGDVIVDPTTSSLAFNLSIALSIKEE